MKTVYAHLIGRFGNQLFCYAHGRAWAQRHGYQLITDAWIGEKIFQIEPTWRIHPEKCDRVLSGYFQNQDDIRYTRKDVREWFKFREPYMEVARQCSPDELLAHRRVGDYPGYGFVVVSKKSYTDAAKQFGYDPEKLRFITEENPTQWNGFGGDLAFLPDFIRLMRARVLFRGNSTFSWWAATLGTAEVYSPVVKGLAGGREQDCEFVAGNWPQMANLDFLSDLYIPEE